MQDTTLVQAERRRQTRAKIAALVLCFGTAAAIYGFATWNEAGGAPEAATLAVMVVGAAAAIAGLAGVLVWRPGTAKLKLMETASYRERVQKEWIGQIAILPAATMGLTLIAMIRADEWLSGEDPSLSGLLLAGLAVLNILLIPTVLMGWDGGSRKNRRLLQDELTQAFRARAMTWGFWTLLIGVGGLYIVGLWKPHAAVVGMPMVLWCAAAMAAFKFTGLHRRAEREMEDDG